MTPLIDVSLVLVVILMVATPMAFQSSISVHRAATSGRAGATPSQTERIEIELLNGGEVRVNDVMVPRAALGETLRPLFASSQTRLVVIRCEDRVSHGAFVGVLDQARQLGAGRIAVMGG